MKLPFLSRSVLLSRPNILSSSTTKSLKYLFPGHGVRHITSDLEVGLVCCGFGLVAEVGGAGVVVGVASGKDAITSAGMSMHAREVERMAMACRAMQTTCKEEQQSKQAHIQRHSCVSLYWLIISTNIKGATLSDWSVSISSRAGKSLPA